MKWSSFKAWLLLALLVLFIASCEVDGKRSRSRARERSRDRPKIKLPKPRSRARKPAAKSEVTCPTGCACGGDKASCQQATLESKIPSSFKTLEIENLSPSSMKKLFQFSPSVKNLIISEGTEQFPEAPSDLFTPMKKLKTLTINDLSAGVLPINFAEAVREAPSSLKSIWITNSRMECSCDLLNVMAERGIELMGSSIQPVQGCQNNGFDDDKYSYLEFKEICAELRNPKKIEVPFTPTIPAMIQDLFQQKEPERTPIEPIPQAPEVPENIVPFEPELPLAPEQPAEEEEPGIVIENVPADTAALIQHILEEQQPALGEPEVVEELAPPVPQQQQPVFEEPKIVENVAPAVPQQPAVEIPEMFEEVAPVVPQHPVVEVAPPVPQQPVVEVPQIPEAAPVIPQQPVVEEPRIVEVAPPAPQQPVVEVPEIPEEVVPVIPQAPVVEEPKVVEVAPPAPQQPVVEVPQIPEEVVPHVAPQQPSVVAEPKIVEAAPLAPEQPALVEEAAPPAPEQPVVEVPAVVEEIIPAEEPEVVEETFPSEPESQVVEEVAHHAEPAETPVAPPKPVESEPLEPAEEEAEIVAEEEIAEVVGPAEEEEEREEEAREETKETVAAAKEEQKPVPVLDATATRGLMEVLDNLQTVAEGKVAISLDINDPYELGLLLRYLRKRSGLLRNIGNSDVKQQVLNALDEDKKDA